MRPLMLIKVDAKGYEAGTPPPQELVDAMGPLMAQWAEQGIMLAAEGLRPIAAASSIELGQGSGALTVDLSDGASRQADSVSGADQLSARSRQCVTTQSEL